GRGLRLWRAGRLPTVTDFLAGGGAAAARGPMSGLLVGWLADRPDRAARFGALFERLAAGRTAPPGWFCEAVLGYGGAADLEEAWDAWMLQQERTVYEPGRASPAAWEALAAERLLYPGAFGIPHAVGTAPLRLRDLMHWRDAPWLEAAVESKVRRLRLMALGRGEAYGAVVEHYAAYLNALRGDADREVLVELLEEAEALHEATAAGRRSGGIPENGRTQ
ncbi:MAG: hypothetical protein JW951_00200, partial [Lentisphaerae bacterium]|nr:hypothetical protein [Lentisphaerota bacterium]